MPHFRVLPAIASFVMLAALPAAAERLPPEALDQQYQACLGRIAGNPDGIEMAAKQNYCACVRDSLASKWDTDKVTTLAQQNQTSGALPQDAMADIEAIGRDCVAKSLR